MNSEVDVTAPPVQTGEERVELHVIHTACHQCVFAQYGQSGTTMTQGENGCELGRLAKYRDQGAEIVEAYGEDGVEFNIIDGRSCPAYRDRRSEWANRVPPANRAAAVRAEMTIRTDVLVPLHWSTDAAPGSKEHLVELELWFGELERTLNGLKALALKPQSVTIVNDQGAVKVGNLIAKLNKLAQGLNWSLLDIRERDSNGDRVNVARVIDLAAAKLKGHFYTVVLPGQVLPPTFTLDLDRAVVDEMDRFVVLLPNSRLEGYTVSLGFHNAPMVNGNKAVPAGALDEADETDTSSPLLLTGVTEKALYLAKARKSPHLVKDVAAVCPSIA